MIRCLATLHACCTLWCIGPAAQAADRFELRDGDRVVLVGNTFIERDQVYGYLETMLTARWPERNITFRNLGWSGDTVWGEARAGFGTAADGFKHLREHVEALKPTVIFIGYGANESFDGETGLPKFKRGMNTLLDMLATSAAPNARMILLSPLRQESLGPPLPDPTEHNHALMLYSEAIAEVSAVRGQVFVDLFKSLGTHREQVVELFRKLDSNWSERPLTDDGIHLSAYGYGEAAGAIESELGLVVPSWLVAFDESGKLARAHGTVVCQVGVSPEHVRFQAKDLRLPAPSGSPRVREGSTLDVRTLYVGAGLKFGNYFLRIDGKRVAKRQAGEDLTVTVRQGPEFEQVEALRRAIVTKNRLYFHRWRPQNETYLFGFRKHEQGQNAAEVPQFDPLVEEQEKLIAKLRVPVKHTYELIHEKEGGD